jgi:hypothetical protein
LGSKLKELERFFVGATFEDIKILDDELIFLGPSYPESSLIFVVKSSASLS